MPSTATGAPTRTTCDSGSVVSGSVSIASVWAFGECTNPGGPASGEARGWPSLSTLPSSTERQPTEQFTVLVGHLVAHHQRANLGKTLAQADPLLHRLFAAVKGFVGFASSSCRR